MTKGLSVVGRLTPHFLERHWLEIIVDGELGIGSQGSRRAFDLMEHDVVIRKVPRWTTIVDRGIHTDRLEPMCIGVHNVDHEIGVSLGNRRQFVKHWLVRELRRRPIVFSRYVPQGFGVIVVPDAIVSQRATTEAAVEGRMQYEKKGSLSVRHSLLHRVVDPIQGTIVGIQVEFQSIRQWVDLILQWISLLSLITEVVVTVDHLQSRDGVVVHLQICIKVTAIRFVRSRDTARELMLLNRVQSSDVPRLCELEIMNNEITGVRGPKKVRPLLMTVTVIQFVVTRRIEDGLASSGAPQDVYALRDKSSIAGHLPGLGVADMDQHFAVAGHISNQSFILSNTMIRLREIDVGCASDDAEWLWSGLRLDLAEDQRE